MTTKSASKDYSFLFRDNVACAASCFDSPEPRACTATLYLPQNRTCLQGSKSGIHFAVAAGLDDLLNRWEVAGGPDGAWLLSFYDDKSWNLRSVVEF